MLKVDKFLDLFFPSISIARRKGKGADFVVPFEVESLDGHLPRLGNSSGIPRASRLDLRNDTIQIRIDSES